jgi:hypothetical protein
MLAASLLAAPRARCQPPVALTNVTVIDGSGGAPRRAATVVLRGGWIEAVGPSRTVAVPTGARVLDLTGRYVMPGLIDMHAHVAMGPVTVDRKAAPPMRMEYDDAASRELTGTLLAFGVTTIRNPAGPTREAVAIRDDVRAGRLRGPRILTAGAVIDRTSFPGLSTMVTSEAEIRAEVAKQVAARVDYVKLYALLPAPLVAAGIDEAHRRGVKAIAHLFATTWTDAANAGIDGILHITPGSPALLPAPRRQELQRSFRGTQFMLEWFEYVDLDSPEITEMLRALVAHHVSLDPTLVVFEALARGNDTAITRSPDLRFAPPSLVENWRSAFTLGMGWTDQDYAAAHAVWPRVLAFTKKLYEAGVLLTAGTDLANPWIGPPAIHRELELLVAAGIPPAEVIRIATRNGAQALGLLSELGTVEAGKRADLLVLTADPLADIRGTRSIEWIIQDGVPHRPEEFLPPRLRADRR